MKRIIILLLLNIFLSSAQADQEVNEEQTALPGTEIVLATIQVKNGKVTLSNEQNITSRAGYDSQPVFMENDKALYFTRYINKQTDIYRMDLKTRVTNPFMQTPESEYSPTPIAGRDGISVVRVDLDKSQSVYWLHKKKKKNIVGLMSDIDNIGYHNWSGKNKLWMFVINGDKGNMFYQVTGQKPKQMATNIGRTIKSDSKFRNIYYVDKSLDDWWIKKMDTKRFKQSKIIALPKGVEDFAIDAKGNYWCGKNNTLYYSDKGLSWMMVKEFSVPGLSNITRIDVNKKLTQIAITFNEK